MLIACLSGCNSCEHNWIDANCEVKKHCSLCGKAEGVLAEHTFTDATCTSPKTCSICGITEGEPIAHSFKDATCTTPKSCVVCGKTEGIELGHDYSEATYEAPQTCTRCGDTIGTALKISDSCDIILCTGSSDDGYIELVSNRIDGYPNSTYEFGVIKDNEWLIPMSPNCPFINENGWWKGAESTNQPGEFKYLDKSCFYYQPEDIHTGIIYNPVTNVIFENLNSIHTNFTDNSEFIGTISYRSSSGWSGEFRYFNMLTGDTHIIEGYFKEVFSPEKVMDISDGLFYASGKTTDRKNFEYIPYRGFFDLQGNMVLDLSGYSILDYHDYKFVNGEYTITCRNNSDVNYDITFDTSGNIIKQEKSN